MTADRDPIVPTAAANRVVIYDSPVTTEPTIREQQRLAEEQRQQRTRQTIATVPIILFAVFVVLWAIPATRGLATGRDEHNPVEIITFLAMAVTGVMAFRLSARVWRVGHSVFTSAFFAAFGAVAILVAGDELAWGQVVVDLFREGAAAAAQAERGLHELSALREHIALVRLGFAVLGIAAVFITHGSRLRFIKAPTELLPWLVVIGAVSLLELIGDLASLGAQFTDFLTRASELTEMMIGVVVLLYIWERARDMWFRIP